MLRSRGTGTTTATGHGSENRTSRALSLRGTTTWQQPLRANPKTKESQSSVGVSRGSEEGERTQKGRGEGDAEPVKNEIEGREKAGKGLGGRGPEYRGRPGRALKLPDRRGREVRPAESGGGRGGRREETTGRRRGMRGMTK